MRENYLTSLKSRFINFKFASLFLLLVSICGGVFGQTTLATGDVAVIGYNTNGSPDNFAILILKDLTAGTTFYINDNEVASSSSAGFTDFNEAEGTFTVQTGQIISAGTVIVLPWGNQTVSSTVYTWTGHTSGGLGNNNDELYIYTGSSATTTSPTFIYFAKIGTSTSAIPQTLTTGTSAITPSGASLRYSTSGATYTGSQNTLLTAIGNTAVNWNTTGATNILANDWTFTVTNSTPTITTTGTLSSVNTTYGTASTTPTSFNVSGANLTNDILITSPTGYEISKTAGETAEYAATQTLTQSSGTVANTKIYVRLKANSTVANSPYSGNIDLSSTGASSVNVATVSSVVSPKALTISGITADNKIYDANTIASLSGTPAYNGLENGETFSVSGTASASFATATVANAKPVTVTGYTAPSSNYTVTQPTLSANITPAILTITSVSAINKVYDGSNLATIIGNLSGLIGTENVSLNLSGTFAQTGIGTALTVTSTSTIGGTDASNYSLTQPTGLTANITPKPLTITGLTANNKVFDGNTTATLSGTATLNGIVSGEEANVTLTGTPTATFAQSAVGTGIAVTVTGYSITGSSSDNYTVSQPTGLTADITNSPSPVINSSLTASATYGEVSTSYFITASNSPTSYNATNLPAGLTVNTTTGEISGTPTEVVGSPFSVTISATNSGGTGTATLVYTVNPKALTVISPSVTNKIYDRTNAATITGTLSGIVGTDVVTLNGTGAFSQITVGSGLAVTSTSTLSGADAAKYTLTQPTGLSGEILVKPLSVSGATVADKEYYGTTTATISGATLVGLVSPDDVTVSGNGNFENTEAGTGKSVTSTLTLGGADATNYSILQPTGLIANINAKSLTITGLTTNNKVYDGNTSTTLSGTPTLNGIVGTDDVSLSGTPVANFNTKNVGTSKSISVEGYTLTGPKSGNYTLSLPSNLTADITPLALTVISPVAQNKVFDGNTNAIITGTLSGILSLEVVTFIGTGTFATSAVGNGIAVTSTSTLGGADAGNYTLTQPTGLTANITPLQFTEGNITVLVAAASSNNTTANIVELNPNNSNQSGTVFQIPTTGPNLLRFSGSASSTGYLANSNDGSLLLFNGANNSNTTANANTLNPRGIGTYNLAGTYNLSTTYTGGSGNQTRSSTTLDNANFFIADQGGIYTNGSTSASPSGNFRGIKSFGGTVYVAQSSATTTLIQVNTVSAPTSGTIVGLPGLSNNSTLQDFYLISSGTNGASFDVLYTLSSSSATVGTIAKYSLVSGSWVANGTYTTTFGGFGLASKKAGSGAELFVSTGTGATMASSVIKLTDVAGFNSTINITTANNIVLYTAPTGTIAKGVAFSPISVPASVNLSVSATSGTEAGATVITVSAISNVPVSGAKTVSLDVTGTNITAGDYALSNTTITIPDGDTTGSVTFTVVDDNTVEATEIATLTISNPSAGLILGGSITQNITITDNDNTPPTITMDVATTSNFVDGGITVSPAGSFATSGVINDPTDAAKNFGIDFTIADVESTVENLTVTATSSNLTVLPLANLNLTGTGASRNLKITPNAEGFANIIITVNDGITTSSFTINYASSNASVNPASTRFHMGVSDASTAQMIDSNLMIVADDENQALRVYDRNNSGLPIVSFDFTSSLGLTDISGGNPREVDIEASAKVGNRIYWMGSHSNSSGGGNRPNRSRFFATDISGTGNTTTLSYIGRYDNLKTELLAWDANNGHGLGANFLGLAASTTVGKAPEIADGSGFNIEGFEIAPNNTTAYICFRAPLQTVSSRTKALIIPVSNFADLVSGNPSTATATFGAPIQLDLGGRAIREIKKNATGEYLILAGPHDAATGTAPKDFRFYTWTGNPADAPMLRSANLTALNADGSFESIVDLPSPLTANSNLQILVDNGDAIFYGNGVIAKELPQNNHKKFRSETVILGSEALLIGSLSGTSFCENTAISIPFTTTETFNAGNIFTAQLSDLSGSFANPVILGTLSGVGSGTISGTIPEGTPAGTGYRIRIISSDFAMVSRDNGTNLTINTCTPLVTIKSIKTGNWEDASTWDLGRIPQAGDLVIIDQNHEVSLNGVGNISKIEYQGTGKLIFSSTTSTLNTGL